MGSLESMNPAQILQEVLKSEIRLNNHLASVYNCSIDSHPPIDPKSGQKTNPRRKNINSGQKPVDPFVNILLR